MNRMLVLLRKDLKEILKSKVTYTYLIIPLFLSYPSIESARSVVQTMIDQGATHAEILASAQAVSNVVFYTVPLIIIMLVCSVLASYAVILDKSKRSIESLLATPLSMRQVWIAKDLAVTIPGSIIGVVMSILVIAVINAVAYMPALGVIVLPDILSLVTGIILVPLLTFFVVGIVTCLQLILSNPRLASFIFSILFLVAFLPTVFTQYGLQLNYTVIYLIVILVFLGINYFMSRFLTKERIVLSSKA
jgi:ABC-2 type transport system permease protein